jgi:hypothetical protein
VSTFDYALGTFEIVGVALSLFLLLVAWRRGGARGTPAAVVLTSVVALTVAQPFGLRATRWTQPVPRNASTVSGTGLHVARIADSVPIVPFVLYQRHNLYTGENADSARERVRSWMWLPILTNATTISTSVHQAMGSDLDRVVLRRLGHTWLVSLVDDSLRPADPGHVRTWKLAPGIASPAGLGYWALAGMFGFLGHIRRRRGGHRAHLVTTSDAAATDAREPLARAGWLPVSAGPVAALAVWLLISVTSSDVGVAATDTIVVLLIWAAVTSAWTRSRGGTTATARTAAALSCLVAIVAGIFVPLWLGSLVVS